MFVEDMYSALLHVKYWVSLFLPLQFFNFGDMSLQFGYSETCHYNSLYIQILPFYMSFTWLGQLSGRICVHIFRMDENTPVASLPPLNDVWAPLVRFFFNLCFHKQAMDGACAYAGWSRAMDHKRTSKAALRHQSDGANSSVCISTSATGVSVVVLVE